MIRPTFPIPSEYLQQQAAAHQAIADSPGYRARPQSRAAELREVAYYSERAAEALVREGA